MFKTFSEFNDAQRPLVQSNISETVLLSFYNIAIEIYKNNVKQQTNKTEIKWNEMCAKLLSITHSVRKLKAHYQVDGKMLTKVCNIWKIKN